MTPELRKRRVEEFIGLMNGKNPDALRALITDDFEYELVWRLPGNEPIRGKEAFVTASRAFFEQMFPNGVRFRFLTAIADGEEVALQAESETIAHNGRPYANRYHYYFRFAGEKIAQGREYCDSSYARETLLG
jgi:ketosteroid isomerase-like protein